ncbi:aldo/keto reductase family [Geminocystis sp. NIES-3708]|uniref:aldo/keto reductase n=1 Tax=Geminocystis sp. NIES-3708 TaxID=1615909 RepID=UPI0005FCD5AB|nr:aldo/keto reductase [Geminocystis sp. NIES-3708]BAQ62296.1 aldo/keto reductase family [Geminocystis sp. NIES-3708]
MKYRRFGKTELNLSVFSLGLMRCCYSQSQLLETVKKALELGINHFETARGYGDSEIFLGLALNKLNIQREKIFITTKFTPIDDGKIVQQWLDESLSRLGVDYIDNIAIHGINTWQHLDLLTKENSFLTVLQEAKKQGKIKHIGFSTHGSLELISATIFTGFFEFINLHYYFFFQRHIPIIELAKQQDLGIFIISPGDKGGRLYQPSTKLSQICQPFTPLLLNYRFLFSHPQITTLSVGASNADDLIMPLSVANDDGELTNLEKETLTKIDQNLRNTLKTDHCLQCYQCLPCPENINIPEILRLRNLGVGLDMTDYASYRYQMLENAGHWFWGKKGDKCTDCGECLPKCPESLNIPELLRDSHIRFNGSARRRLWE